jgi:EpsI family protein
MNRRSLVFAALSVGAAGSALALRPSKRAAEVLTRIDLERQIPQQIGDWKIDKGLLPVLPNPEVQAALDQIYTQVLARSYVRPDGVRIMITIAYGADQATDATSVHRPEFCYSAQGFAVKNKGDAVLALGSKQLRVRRLEGRLGTRVEPITYWVTLNNDAVLPGVERKLQQIRFGLAGLIPDGMLVRISSIMAGNEDAYGLHEGFARALNEVIDPGVSARYFGA